jgi:hypothetical protein
MFDSNDLLLIAQTKMPFGKYQGRYLIDIPEEYLLWFAKKGFPEGKLGRLLGLTLEIKIEGLDALISPLKKR